MRSIVVSSQPANSSGCGQLQSISPYPRPRLHRKARRLVRDNSLDSSTSHPKCPAELTARDFVALFSARNRFSPPPRPIFSLFSFAIPPFQPTFQPSLPALHQKARPTPTAANHGRIASHRIASQLNPSGTLTDLNRNFKLGRVQS